MREIASRARRESSDTAELIDPTMGARISKSIKDTSHDKVRFAMPFSCRSNGIVNVQTIDDNRKR